MKAFTWHSQPELRDPTVFVGFSGWSDAADAASGAVAYLLEQATDVELLASIGAEEFFDFSQTRPEIHITDGITQGIEWPAIRLSRARLPGADHDLVVVEGPEPEFRWPTLTDHLVDAFHEMEASAVVLFGAFIGRVAHTLPVPIMAVASDETLLKDNQLLATDYQGPTGLVGALNAACSSAGFSTVGLWAAIPHYLAGNPNPRAMMALLEKASEITGIAINLEAIEIEAIAFHRHIEAAVAASTELQEYVGGLEDDADDLIMEPEAGERLVNEIERFLREPE
ncbi:MAG: PAC2 family protein [Acidimicrobiia bacterium]|nr:PAC2 family protein [Acidimicrobiia bacterium]